MTPADKLLLLMGEGVCERRSVIEEALTTSYRIVEWRPADGEAAGIAMMADAAAMVTGGDALMKGPVFKSLPLAKNLKFWQIPFTGYEWLDFAFVPAGCVVANAYGHEIAMAEFVLGAMLQWEKDFTTLDATLRTGSWQHRGVAVNDFLQGELYGKTLGIVGYGAIARETAARAAAFGMNVAAVSRTPRNAPAPLSWYGTMDQLPVLLAKSDFVLLTCELNDETRGLIAAPELSALDPDGVLINVARAGVVNEDDLFAALRDKSIGGAILDVWYQYPDANQLNPAAGGPMPSRHDFASLQNVIMTPHCAANTLGSDIRRYKNIARNLDLVASGKRPATYIGEGPAPR